MSGSDGSGSSYNFGSGVNDDCANVELDAAVESPFPDENFTVGKSYRVELNSDGAVQTVQLWSDRVVGAVRPVPPLVRCLGRGVTFSATVTVATGGDIKVHITAS